MTLHSKIKISNAHCSFRRADGTLFKALRGIDLEIPKGQFLCIVGPSGGGKSTLVRSIAGLSPLTSGQIAVDGQKITGPSLACGMVFQDDTVFPWLRVLENVEYGLRARGLPAEQARDWLKAVGLADTAGSWPKELSGGMRKRVALAAVFAAGSDVLIMDEPFGALDYVTRLSLHDIVLGLWQRTRRTVVFVTHDIEEALVLGDRVVVIGNGEVVDDIMVDLPRPRSEDERASPEAVKITKTVVGHLRAAALEKVAVA